MTFLTLLIVCLIERFWQAVAGIRRWGWLTRYNQWVARFVAKTSFNKPAVSYLLVVISLLIIVLIIQRLLLPFTYATWLYLFNFLVLLYCMGPSSFYQPFRAVLPVSDAAGDKQPLLSHTDDLYGEVIRVNQMVFAPFFWFAVLGAFGAVMYRVTEQLPKNNFVRSAVNVLDWIPARLLAFTFGLVSYFVMVFPVWARYLCAKPQDNSLLLTECTKISLADDQNSVHLVALIDRSLIVWLVVLALVVLL